MEFLLPVFPLQIVLLPRTNLALHIFEERYKLMIGDCLEHGWEFGILLLEEDSLATTGCTASIENVVRKYDDGRMDIVVRGQRRFEVLHLDQQKPYTRCATHFFDDEEEAPPSAASLRRNALALYADIRQKLPPGDRSEHDSEPNGPDVADPQLSFQIAARLPADRSFRQSLLAVRSESDRLSHLISYLHELKIVLARAADTRARAARNGRPH